LAQPVEGRRELRHRQQRFRIDVSRDRRSQR
jgi:hypothetical protein